MVIEKFTAITSLLEVNLPLTQRSEPWLFTIDPGLAPTKLLKQMHHILYYARHECTKVPNLRTEQIHQIQTN